MRITLNHIVKEFVSLRRRVTALRDVSLKIEDGEFFVLLGSSGCGKSTLLNVIAGLEQPTSGELRFDEEIVASAQAGIWLPPSKRNIAMVFQSYALYPHLSVYDNIAFPLDVAGRAKSEIAQAVERAAAMLEIAPLLRAKPAELSGGQRQRVAIARALVTNTRLIVLDEPVSALDVSIRAQIINQLEHLQQVLGVSYLFIGHDLATVAHISHRIAVMYLGQIVEVADSQVLCEQPLHPYTKALFAAALPAHPDDKREEVVLTGEVPSALNPPSGCRFHPRCPFAMPRCAQEEPVRKEVAAQHLVACHLY